MPNRFLKDSICTSETIAQLTAEEERFFYRLIVQCDDYGRLDARPRILRTKLFPLLLETITDEDIAKWLYKLAEVSLLSVYVNSGKPYIQIITWDKHQQIRAKNSKYPQADSECSTILSLANICYQTLSDVSICTRITNTITKTNPLYESDKRITKTNNVNDIINHSLTDNTTKEKTTPKEADNALAVISTCYEENIGKITPLMADILKEISQNYSVEWFTEAVKEATSKNVHNMKYVRAILKNWDKNGFKNNGHELAEKADEWRVR